MNNDPVDPPPGLALLAVDIQPPFVQVIPDAARLLPRICFALRAARLLGIPVLMTEQVPDKLGATEASLREAAGDAPVFAKNAFSALDAQGVSEHLEQLDVQHLLLVGLEVPICLYQTVIDCQRRGLDVTLLTDCISARRADDQRAVLDSLRGTDCHQLPSETVFYSILGSAEHPCFRDYTRLVKSGSGSKSIGR